MNDLSFSKSTIGYDAESSVLSDQITITKTVDGMEQETVSDSYDYSTSDDLCTSRSHTKTFTQMTNGNKINEERL